MAISARRGSDAVAFAQALAHNKLLAATAIVGSSFHADITATTGGDYTAQTVTSLQVTAANATDLPSVITLVNQIQSIALVHLADGISTNASAAGAHKVPDTTNNTAIATATDLATSITMANGWKTRLNAHFTQSGVHFTNDATNTIAAANATDLATAITLVNALKAALNPHITAAPAGSLMLNLSNP